MSEKNRPIMPYNEDQDRPYKNPKVQSFYKTEWIDTHIAHRWWSHIDVEDQMKLVVYNFKHWPDRKKFRIIDLDGNVIKEFIDDTKGERVYT